MGTRQHTAGLALVSLTERVLKMNHTIQAGMLNAGQRQELSFTSGNRFGWQNWDLLN